MATSKAAAEKQVNDELEGDVYDDDNVEYQNPDFYNTRFYRARVPDKDDLVWVENVELKDLGAQVRLLEYGNIEGFIQMSNLTRKRTRSIKNLLKIGKREMMEVIRVDAEKMYIDLSKKNLSPDAVDEAKQKFKKSKKVHEIMIEVAIKLKVDLESLYEAWGWELYENCGFEHAYDAIRVCLQDPEAIFSKINISKEHQEVLLQTLHRKMTINPFKIRVDFSLTCTTFDGIEVIKEALLTAKHEINDETWKLDFKMIAPPVYKCEVITHQRAEGEQKLRDALAIIKRVMRANKGHFKQMGEPTIIGSNKDDTDVAELINYMAAKDQDEEEDGEEDNQEGMGDIDLTENVVDAEESDEEEKKQ